MKRVIVFILRLPIRFYKYVISPLIGPSCRHLPTCSSYAEEALIAHGPWAGLWLGLSRFCRCHPYGTDGYDAVPKQLPENSVWYFPWRYGRWSWRSL